MSAQILQIIVTIAISLIGSVAIVFSAYYKLREKFISRLISVEKDLENLMQYRQEIEMQMKDAKSDFKEYAQKTSDQIIALEKLTERLEYFLRSFEEQISRLK